MNQKNIQYGQVNAGCGYSGTISEGARQAEKHCVVQLSLRHSEHLSLHFESLALL